MEREGHGAFPLLGNRQVDDDVIVCECVFVCCCSKVLLNT